MLEKLLAFLTSGKYRSYGFLRILSVYNAVVGRKTYVPPTDLNEFKSVQLGLTRNTDIADHLPTIFSEALQADPDTIVELGVRDGESTAVFEEVCGLTGADLVSVDIDEAEYESNYEDRYFVQADDVEFARQFKYWCEDHAINPEIDVLFIDTSHLYEHTVEEIDSWFPHLTDNGVVLFHDTNLSNVYCRKDRTLGTAWDNDRGVIRAIEEYLDCSFDEKRDFTTVCSGFLVDHYPYCNGFTILRRIDQTIADDWD